MPADYLHQENRKIAKPKSVAVMAADFFCGIKLPVDDKYGFDEISPPHRFSENSCLMNLIFSGELILQVFDFLFRNPLF